MWALITAALQGLAALPKIFDFIVNLNIEARLKALEQNAANLQEAYKLLSEAKTSEEKINAADAIAHAWNNR